MQRAPRIIVSDFWHRESGSIMPIFVMCLAAILGLVGATLALSMDTKSANEIQQTADSAALGGAVAFVRSENPKVQVRLEEAKAQTTSLANGNAKLQLSDLAIESLSEDAYGQKLKLSVEVEFKPVNAAASLTGRNASVDIRRRAVAEATWGFPLCVLALKGGMGFIPRLRVRKPTSCMIWTAKGR